MNIKEQYNEILIVDDDHVTCQIHKINLVKLSSQPVLLYTSGRLALNYVSSLENREKNFLILLDIYMPGLNGWDFVKACESLNSERQLNLIIVTSSINKEDNIKTSCFSKILDHFEKPLGPHEFAKISQYLETGPFLREAQINRE